nr:MAG TPA: Protein of unknown function (DUF2973) [Caudoviricetes sp.]
MIPLLYIITTALVLYLIFRSNNNDQGGQI